MLAIGIEVNILNLKGNKKGKIIDKFKCGSVDYYRVMYQSLGDTHIHTTTKRHLKEIR